MKKSYKILVLIFSLLAVAAPGTKGQMLETVDLSYTGSNYNTYLTGINNSGFVCGYYNNGSIDIGFVITNKGKLISIYPNIGNTSVKVESINDNGVAIVTKLVGSTTEYYKYYIDTITGAISSNVQLTMQQASAKPFDINNNNDVSGWYQSTQRWLYVLHDSIVPIGNSAWEANRYSTPGPVYYQTQGFGINDANKVVGFYIDGVLTESFVYDNLNGTFTTLPSSFSKVESYDINNNNWVAGRYRQNNNIYMGFVANVGTGSFTQFTSLDNIFDNNTIQSEATGINDNMDVVGSFYHPVSNRWVGFIYHKNASEFRLPAFNYASETWSLRNSRLNWNAVWPDNYWVGTDYQNTDPYALNSGKPLVDSTIIAMFNINMVHDSVCPKWSSFAEEVDTTIGIAQTTDPDLLDKYNTILKPFWFALWKATSFSSFKGLCYGLTYSVLFKHFQDSTYAAWTGMPANSHLPSILNSDFTAIKSIERFNIKQFDARLHHPTDDYPNMGVWEGLYKLKHDFLKPLATSDPSGIALLYAPGMSHSVAAYKIRTPQTLPFDYPVMKYDTLFIYDPNNPMDSTHLLRVQSDRYYVEHDSVYSPFYNDPNLWYGPPLKKISFHQPSINKMLQVEHSFSKSTSSNDYDPEVAFSIFDHSYYNITGPLGTSAQYDNSGYTLSGDEFSTLMDDNLDSTGARSHVMDTTTMVSIVSNNYTDGRMILQQSNKRRLMGISRTAQLSETDYSSQKNGMMGYSNPDATTKYINAFKIETNSGLDEGVNIIARNICVDQADSILTQSESPYTFTIKKLVGTSSCTYDLLVYAIENNEVIKFTAPVTLQGPTTHVIDPYFQGTNGTQIAVIVDNGNDGSADDTLFVTGWPLGLHSTIEKGSIRIYPNPAHEELNVELAESGNYTFTMTDVVGKIVYSQQHSVPSGKTVIPVGSLPTGVYLIQVSDARGTTLIKDKILKL